MLYRQVHNTEYADDFFLRVFYVRNNNIERLPNTVIIRCIRAINLTSAYSDP